MLHLYIAALGHEENFVFMRGSMEHLYSKSEGEFHPRTVHEDPEEGIEVQPYSFFNLGAGWGGWSRPRPGRFTPENDPVAIL
jgi:hypothetical protein